MVEVGEYSRELCGGTHVARSGQLGLVKLLGEASIGSGVRRIEALVGIDAFRFLARESVLVGQLSEQLKARREELPERISDVVTRLRDAERELERLKSAQLLELGGRDRGQRGGHRRGRARRAPGAGRNRRPTTSASSRSTCAAGCRAGAPRWSSIIGVPADRPVVVVAVNEAGRGFGLSAGSLVGDGRARPRRQRRRQAGRRPGRRRADLGQ